jgi:hypothetical protein
LLVAPFPLNGASETFSKRGPNTSQVRYFDSGDDQEQF